MGRGGVGANPIRSCDAVLRDVRRKTARERVRMMDLFADFDRLGHGESVSNEVIRPSAFLICSSRLQCEYDSSVEPRSFVLGK